MKALTLLLLAAVLYTAQGYPYSVDEESYKKCEMSSTQLSSDEVDKMLELHNDYRAKDSQESGKRIPEMTWSDDLAQRAQAWADELARTQSFNHGFLETCEGVRMGQNLWQAGTTSCKLQPASNAVVSWYDEKGDYNYNANSCTPGKMCGHYTQIVWAKSTELGCGKATFKSGKWNYIVVACDYYPPGNYVGQRPY